MRGPIAPGDLRLPDRRLVVLVLAALALLAPPRAFAQASPAPSLPPPSTEAQRIFEGARAALLQIRTLALPARSQASTGSGFVVGPAGLIATNFHVVAQAALEPSPHALEFVSVDGASGPLELVAIDVRRDLALLRRSGEAPAPLPLAAIDRELRRGERLFALGKPLDLGFVVTEGLSNGVVERDLYGHLLYTGSLNPGMSGGPALDAGGRVIGVNVARRLGAELTSFLVPVRYLHEMLAAPPQDLGAPAARWAEVERQLLLHQADMIDALLEAPFPSQLQGPFRVAVLPDRMARCWGGHGAGSDAAIQTSSTQCSLQSERFVSPSLQTGGVAVVYRSSETQRLGAWRFWHSLGASRSMPSGAGAYAFYDRRHRTPERCEEDYVATAAGTFLVAFCLRAYHRFAGLFDASLRAVSVERPTSALTLQLIATGVSEANARRVAAAMLGGLAWAPSR